MKNVLIVDDEPKIREVVASYLQKEGFQTLEAETGKEAISKSNQADFIILDLMLPDLSGENVCQTIRRQSSVPILMLTAKVMENERIEGLTVGADDYMMKPFSPRELVMRVKTILRRSTEGELLAETLSYEGGLTIHTGKKEAYVEKERAGLTPNEYKLLVFMARNPERTFSRDELIERVLGIDFEGDSRTIDQHIKNLRHKIEQNPKEPVYILTTYGIGYRFSGGKVG